MQHNVTRHDAMRCNAIQDNTAQHNITHCLCSQNEQNVTAEPQFAPPFPCLPRQHPNSHTHKPSPLNGWETMQVGTKRFAIQPAQRLMRPAKDGCYMPMLPKKGDTIRETEWH